jgi:HEAT repeat protein
MKTGKIIPFEPRERLLEKARALVGSPAPVLDGDAGSFSVLLQAFKKADENLKQEIVLLLGSVAGGKAVWPLYRIMTDASQDEEIRHMASIQLSVAAGFLKDPDPLVERLLEDIKSPDPQLRSLAAFAMGWEGNERAAVALIERLYDEDGHVQETAVNALANLRDDRLLQLLIERLRHGPLEQKRAILFNLWRFRHHKDTAAAIYLDFLAHENESLRFDALVLLEQVSDPGRHFPALCRCLGDGSPRIRALALTRLERLADEVLQKIRDQIEALRNDPDPKVKAAAFRILERF